MELHHSFSEISPVQINTVVAGRFFQADKSCLKRLIGLSKEDPRSLLVVDISPKESDHLTRVYLSTSERRSLFSQLKIGHFISVDDQYFFKHVLENFQSVIPGLKKEVRIHTLNANPIAEKNNRTKVFLVPLKAIGKEFNWHQKLGYLYPLSGKVIRGNMIGRTIGFPTANLQIDDKSKLLPPVGVYSGMVRIAAGWHKAMINIGIRPTLNLDNLTIEANIFDFDGDLYGQNMSLHFYKRIRDELSFPSLNYLRSQLNDDKRKASEFLENLGVNPGKDEYLIIAM